MKNTLVVLTTTLFCGALALPLWAGDGLTRSGTRARIRQDVAGLLQAEQEIRIKRAEIAGTRDVLDTDILSQQDRGSRQGQIGEDQEIIANYHEEGMDEVGFLQSHWDSLTRGQKDLVSQALIDLGRR